MSARFRRRPHLRRGARAAVVVLACAASGGCGTPRSVAIELSLDETSCGTTDPAALSVDCIDGAIGIYALIEGRAEVDSVCVPFSAQPGATVQNLPAFLAGWDEAVDTYREGQALRIELYVYPGPCPPLDQRSTGVLLWGLSDPVTLEAPNETLGLVLHCEADMVPCP